MRRVGKEAPRLECGAKQIKIKHGNGSIFGCHPRGGAPPEKTLGDAIELLDLEATEAPDLLQVKCGPSRLAIYCQRSLVLSRDQGKQMDGRADCKHDPLGLVVNSKLLFDGQT